MVYIYKLANARKKSELLGKKSQLHLAIFLSVAEKKSIVRGFKNCKSKLRIHNPLTLCLNLLQQA